MKTKKPAPGSLAADLMEMMTVWKKIERAAKKRFPHADKEELYQICAGAMNYSLGIK